VALVDEEIEIMVAQLIRKPRSTYRGVLPFDPVRDLGAVARLLEAAFREDSAIHFSRVPLMRELGIFMWMLNYVPAFPENISGLVWVEDEQVVGNLTLTRDEGWSDRYYISNVAVKHEYRRKGIARQLMRVALSELHAHSAKWALLNVRPTNPGAIELYKEFGFQEIEMRGEWMRTSPLIPRSPLPPPVARGEGRGDIRPLRWSDHRAVVELVRAATPANVKQFRRQEINPYWLYWEDRFAEIISDFFILRTTRRWVFTQNDKLGAIVTVHGQRIFSPHRIEVQVHPDFRGRVEDRLVTFAMNELARFPSRAVRATLTSTHPELIAALEAHGFKFQKGLTLMALGF
jgi:ribosomal protein S18 acetylase RimI-like enzyme